MAQTGYTPILIYSSSTASQAPAAGNLTNSTLGSELAINITDGKLFYKDNANAVQVIGWKTVPTTAGGTGLTSYAAGDLIYFAAGTAFTKLAIGASTTILTSSGAAPQWSLPSGITVGTATNLAGGLAGSVPYQSSAGTTTFLGIGAANTVLTSSGTAPQWSTGLNNVTIGATTATTGRFTTIQASTNIGVGTATTVQGIFNVGGGRSFFGANSETYSIGLGFTQARVNSGQTFYIGATNATAPALVFSNSAGTERVRFFDGGGVGVGTTTDPGAGNIGLANGKYIRLPSASTNFDLKGNAGGNDYLSIDANGTQRHQFNDAGAAYNTTGTWGTISDARLKENINDATAKLADVLKLRVVNYNLKTDPEIKQIGFVAQEIEQVFPGLVEQGEPTEDGDFYKSVKTSVLIPILVKAMQEQQTQIDELKNQLSQLKGN